MNQSFENIFEKYNITCEVPTKRYKTSKKLKQSQKCLRKELELIKCSLGQKNASTSSSIKSLNLHSYSYFNTNTKGKYNIPTRYKTLDVVGIEYLNSSVVECRNCNICESCCSSKENCSQHKHKRINNVEVRPQCLADVRAIKTSETNNISNGCISDCTQNGLSDSSNIKKGEQRCKKPTNNPYVSYKQLNGNFRTKSFHTSEVEFPQPSYHNDAHNVTKVNENTELDLLIDLIKQEERNNKIFAEYNQNRKLSNCDDNLSYHKSCLKGGYQELFERALKQEKVKSNFLKYDKKIGLRTGQILSVVKIDIFYGLTLATVKSEVLYKDFVIAIGQDNARHLKIGSQIEAFFDDKTFPHKLQLSGSCLDVYLEPYKLLSA